MVTDAVRPIGRSLVQHGRHNQRVYVMRISPDDIPDIIRPLDDLARQEGHSKIFVKVPASAARAFSEAGYVAEATVPGFFNGQEAGVFMAKYSDPHRSEVADPAAVGEVLSVAFGYANNDFSGTLPAGFSLVTAHPGDAEEIAALYRSAFATYPFPISDPEYIARSMKDGIRYFCIRKSKTIVAVSSCEVHAEAENAEMTDFATDAKFQGKGLAGNLLHAMEASAEKEGVQLAYTISRATSMAANILFARAGYSYAGILPNNTNIGGKIESMNVWYKPLGAGRRHG